MSDKNKNTEAKPTYEALVDEIEALKAENEAFKVLEEATKDPESLAIPSKEDRTFKVKDIQYRFAEVNQIFFAGIKRPLTEVLKDQDILSALVKNKSKLVTKTQD